MSNVEVKKSGARPLFPCMCLCDLQRVHCKRLEFIASNVLLEAMIELFDKDARCKEEYEI
jgi:hypothetical protein